MEGLHELRHDLYCVLEKYPISLPGWQVIGLIYVSEHSVLYLAENKHGQRSVIKRFNYSIRHLEDHHIHDFIEAVDTIRAIGFGGLVDIYHTGLSSDSFYLLMEYLDNGSLSEIIAVAIDAVTLEQKLDWFEDIAISVGTLHNAGLLHRDLKPANVMFRDNNELVLVDCGIESEWLINTGFITAGEVYCTPNYVSPERAGGEPCDVRTEVYSLGIIFYELLVGERPYSAGNMVDLVKKHALAPIPLLPEHLSAYQAVFEKMVAKYPDDRYESVDEMLEDLYFAT